MDQPVKTTKYVVITPARDEGPNIERAIQSLLAQTVRPQEWVIVNDGSKDQTGEIIDRFAKQFSWIRPTHRKDRGARKSGGGVIEAFDDGYRTLQTKDWEFIVKLDGDLSYDADYFEKCFAEFHNDKKLGIGGGTICHRIDGELVVRGTGHPAFHVRGATKIYRRECWDAIGGLVAMTGWDTIDEMKANHVGWTTRSFRDLLLVEHRLTGAADGTWRNSVKNGRANYITGYHPLFMIAKCVKRIPQRPLVVDAAGLFCGYFGSWLKRLPRVGDEGLIAYVRKEQMRRLFLKDGLYGGNK